MKHTGFRKRNSVIIAVALCAALMVSSIADSKAGDNDDNDHYNEQVYNYIRNLISAYFKAKYGSHNSGNDSESSDSSFSNEEDSSSVLNLLGVEENEGEPIGGLTDTPPIITPTTITSNPFEGQGTTDDEPSTTEPESKTTLPYGSVPLIQEDEVSVDYILQKLLLDARQSAEANGEPTNLSPVMIESYEDYARKLAKTLSQLSPAEQDFVFYGVVK